MPWGEVLIRPAREVRADDEIVGYGHVSQVIVHSWTVDIYLRHTAGMVPDITFGTNTRILTRRWTSPLPEHLEVPC